jgi:hypothetical protein
VGLAVAELRVEEPGHAREELRGPRALRPEFGGDLTVAIEVAAFAAVVLLVIGLGARWAVGGVRSR